LQQPLTLSQIAEVAWLSTHHFLRLFKRTFHETPHQYLIRKRIERAKYLLAHTDLSVTDVCLEVGFESLGSFSWLFRRRVGASPETFRLQNGNGVSRKRIWSQLALSAGG
jgi:AraC-like DNA-binding protein